jgi:hypothetical protein
VTAVLDAAVAFAQAGCSVIPAAADGTKAPQGAWKNWQATRPGQDQLHAWLDNGHPGIGIVTGAISGNLEMLEFEVAAVRQGLIVAARDLATAAGLQEAWQRLSGGYMEATPSGGVHFLYRVTGVPVPGNIKLARGPAHSTLIETRGEGGFTIVAPSAGPVHPTGKPWALLSGGPAAIPVLDAADRDALHAILRTLGEPPEPPAPFTQPHREQLATGGLAPGEDYNQRTDWAEILKPLGWQHVTTRGTVRYWRRPGKERGISATTGRPPHDNLYVFTTSTPLDPEVPYSKFGVLAELEYGGDHSAAASALRAQGYGTPLPDTRGQLGDPPVFQQPAHVPAAASHDQAPPAEPAAAAAAPAGQLPEFDLGALAAQGIPEPERIAAGMLYPGAVHCIAGMPGGGKTTIAAWWMLTHIRDGGNVMLLDEESGPEQAAEKFLDLGATPGELSPPRLTYVPFPARGWNTADLFQLHALIADRKPGIITWDSAAAFLAIAGQDENSATDVTAFWQKVLVPCARQHGAAVVAIDHTVKSGEHAGFGRGSGAKKAASDVQYMMETIKPFNRSQNGVLRLTTAPGKDRRGWLEGAYEVLVKTGDTITLEVTPVTATAITGGTQMNGAKAKLWEALTAIATEQNPMTSTQLVDWIARRHGHGLKRQTASTNLNQLAADGLADCIADRPGREKLWYPVVAASDIPWSDPTAGDADTSPDTFRQPSGRAARNCSSASVSASDDASPLTRQAASAPPEGADDDADTPTRRPGDTSPARHCGTCGERLPHQGRPCQDPGAAA